MAWKHRKYPQMARYGKENGRWDGGHSKSFYRRIAGCKKNDGKVVHHISNRTLVVLDNRGNSSRAKHNKLHPEKGGYHIRKKKYGVRKKR